MWPDRACVPGLPVYKKGRSRPNSRRRSRGLGKRGTLGKASILGPEKQIDILDVDLGRLVGGKSCSIPYTIFRNGFQVFSSALADSGANAFTLVNAKCAHKLSEYLATPFETLPALIQVRGYNGTGVQAITTVLRMYIRVDGRRQYNVLFLVADLGSIDLILGRKWLSYLGLHLDVRNRRLVWPEDLPPTPYFIKEVGTSIESLLRPVQGPNY